jgi:hypothetical protein
MQAPAASVVRSHVCPADPAILRRCPPTTLAQVFGLGWANYWKVGWNRFDLLLVLCSVADMLVTLIGNANISGLKIQKVMRLLRLARVVKLMRGMKVRACWCLKGLHVCCCATPGIASFSTPDMPSTRLILPAVCAASEGTPLNIAVWLPCLAHRACARCLAR